MTSSTFKRRHGGFAPGTRSRAAGVARDYSQELSQALGLSTPPHSTTNPQFYRRPAFQLGPKSHDLPPPAFTSTKLPSDDRTNTTSGGAHFFRRSSFQLGPSIDALPPPAWGAANASETMPDTDSTYFKYPDFQIGPDVSTLPPPQVGDAPSPRTVGNGKDQASPDGESQPFQPPSMYPHLTSSSALYAVFTALQDVARTVAAQQPQASGPDTPNGSSHGYTHRYRPPTSTPSVALLESVLSDIQRSAHGYGQDLRKALGLPTPPTSTDFYRRPKFQLGPRLRDLPPPALGTPRAPVRSTTRDAAFYRHPAFQLGPDIHTLPPPAWASDVLAAAKTRQTTNKDGFFKFPAFQIGPDVRALPPPQFNDVASSPSNFSQAIGHIEDPTSPGCGSGHVDRRAPSLGNDPRRPSVSPSYPSTNSMSGGSVRSPCFTTARRTARYIALLEALVADAEQNTGNHGKDLCESLGVPTPPASAELYRRPAFQLGPRLHDLPPPAFDTPRSPTPDAVFYRRPAFDADSSPSSISHASGRDNGHASPGCELQALHPHVFYSSSHSVTRVPHDDSESREHRASEPQVSEDAAPHWPRLRLSTSAEYAASPTSSGSALFSNSVSPADSFESLCVSPTAIPVAALLEEKSAPKPATIFRWAYVPVYLGEGEPGLLG